MPSQADIERIKYRLTIPHTMPRMMLAGTRSTIQAPSRWKLNSESLPINIYVKHVAVTAAVSIGSSDAMLKSTISTSKVNTNPAIGALKIPAIAAAAPQPTSSISVLLSMRNNCPRLEPMAEPVSTIGASAPTDPPKPMVMADARTDVQQLCPLRRDCFEDMA